jgi:UDP-N-acetylmuramoylalanine--D-glutamate ligase
MTIYTGTHVVILGLARQGTALARFFLRAGADVTISDVASADQLTGPLTELDGTMVRLVLGSHPYELLDRCDLLCLSGGVPPQIPLVAAARRQGITLSNDTLITIEHSPAPAIGITGSSGKTTTTTLVGLMLDASRALSAERGTMNAAELPNSSLITPRSSFHVWVGGNIGVPLVDKLEQIHANDWLVLELSSFQLELFDAAAGGRSLSPQVAAILNITPNHLDRHPSMAHYAACKANILRWQTSSSTPIGTCWPEPIAVLGADDAITGRWLRARRVEIEAAQGQEARAFPLTGRLLGFGLGEATGDGCWLNGDRIVLRMDDVEKQVIEVDHILLRGRHNIQNVAAACAIGGAIGVEPEAMAEVASSFGGVEHRLELVRELDGVRWYNDSIATAPERATAALCSFDEPIVLLAGGRDKKLPWNDFAQLARQRVRVLVVFGEAAELIARAVGSEHGDTIQIIHCDDLASAVTAAAQAAQTGDVVLLSPGGTSFDAYKDFTARGEHFRLLVRAL